MPISTIPICTITISTISISTILTLSDLKLDGIATTGSDFADASKNLLTKQNKNFIFVFLFLYHFYLSIYKEVNVIGDCRYLELQVDVAMSLIAKFV
jgi:hypothetical protein